MKPHFQLIPHDPASGVFGDCLRTCIASLLHLEPQDVPHILHDNSDDFLARLNAFLANFKLAYMVFDASEPDTWRHIMAAAGHDLHHLITVRSGSTTHQIIGRNGKPVWCPIHGDVQGCEFEMLEFGFLVFTSL